MILEAVKKKSTTVISFLVANISCSLFQIFVLMFLGYVQLFILFIFGGIISILLGNGEFALNIPDVTIYIIIAVIYGVFWLCFWRMLFKDGIKWFYYRIFFSIIPLIVALMMFNPTLDPMAMLPMPKEPIFSCLVTGIILLPIYSVLIYKFILQSSINKVRNSILVCLVTILIGSLIFYESWNMVSVIYSYFEFKPLFQI
jgi:hypothetical protein